MELKELTSNQYRLDLQGLRVLGAIIILIFHIWFNKVSGGVDIFFVLSGYLMTSVITNDFLNSGSKSIIYFWCRIAKRITPSALVVLTLTLIVGYQVIPPSNINAFLEEVMASVFHIENIKLIFNSVDYLAREFPPSPVQQFWALSVQVQFYFLLPIILLPTLYISQQRKDILLPQLILCMVIIASFIYAQVLIETNESAAYFHPIARAWEFFTGAFLFFIIKKLNFKPTIQNILSLVGLVLIFIAAVIVPKDAVYPGPVALIPVLAAVCIITAGHKSLPFINQYLSTPAFSKMGNYSFTVYLCHWPILVFVRELNGNSHIGFLLGMTIVILSFGLAFLITKIVEAPLKKVKKEKWITVFSFAFIFSGIVAGYAYFLNKDFANIGIEVYESVDNIQPQNFIERPITLNFAEPTPTRTDIISARWFRPKSIRENCQQSVHADQLIACEFGAKDSKNIILLAGSSHAAQWMYPLEQLALQNKLKLIVATKSGCPLGALQDSGKSCEIWNEELLAFIKETKPNLIITNTTLTSANKKESVPDEWRQVWKQIESLNIDILGIRDNPRREDEPATCISRNGEKYYNTCGLNAQDLMMDAKQVKKSSLNTTIDMTPYLCTTEMICPPTNNGLMILRDKGHIHEIYVRHISKKFMEQASKYYPNLFSPTQYDEIKN